MTKTTLQNKTDSAIILNESQAGILRKLAEVQPEKTYVVHSQLNQTYKEYLCVSKNSNQFTLSTDDLCEWKEIWILKPTDGDSGKLIWEGKLTRPQNPDGKNSSGTPPPSSVLSKVRNKVVGWFQKPKQPAPPPTGTDASTAPPAATTDTDASTAPPAAS